MDELRLDGRVEGEALAVVVARVLGVEVVEVVGRTVDEADLIRLGLDEVAGACLSAVIHDKFLRCVLQLSATRNNCRWLNEVSQSKGRGKSVNVDVPKFLQVGRVERVFWETRPASSKHVGFFVSQILLQCRCLLEGGTGRM